MGETDAQTTSNDAAGNPTAPKKSPDVGQTYDRSLVYAEDGKLWREKFTGQQGRADELAKKIEGMQESFESNLTKLKSEVESRESRINELRQELDTTGQRVEELRALEDQVPELEQQARQAAKLRAVLEYPELVNRQVKDMIEMDGEEHEVVANPILDLVESTNLEGDELRTHLRRLNEIVKAGEPVQKESTETPGKMEGAAPAPGEPVEETPQYWEDKAREAHANANTAPPQEKDEWLDKMHEYSEKAKEARAALQS